MMTWVDEGPHDAEDRQQLQILAHVLEPGDRVLGKILWERGPKEVLRRIEQESRHSGIAARLREFGTCDPESIARSVGARIITRLDREWPHQLDDLGPTRPVALWVQGAGDLRTMALHSVAFVGARAATRYGEEVCRQWVGHCCDAGLTIVSGGAYGIDSAAHRAALSAQGMTIAILASGVDVHYPRGNEALLARIADSGLLMSESPPGATVRRQRFLTRNRLIAALTRATVVVEAALRSGTTATANAANAIQRPVLAIPGPVTSAMSAGCHHLINERQADLASHWSDVLSATGGLLPGAPPIMRQPWDDLSPKSARVLDALPARGAMSLHALVVATGLTVPDVLSGVGQLLARGLLVEIDDGFRRTSGAASHAFPGETAP
jgi:DNA processing protein